ncbi:MAG: hypothetical protein K0Q73_4371 [Paenibacillus sp.]|jgi:hypothetical protein|nr:hypothetical protein [Paenibacillus sp.]
MIKQPGSLFCPIAFELIENSKEEGAGVERHTGSERNYEAL